MIIWLDGPINAGKTTVATRLAALRPRTIHIEVDELRHFADCLTLEECSPFCIEDSAALSRRWLDRGFDVVLSWPVSIENLDRFQQQVPETVHVFTLLPRKEVALSKREDRELSETERARIEYMYSAMFSRPAGTVIDNSDQSVEKTVERIIRDIATAG